MKRLSILIVLLTVYGWAQTTTTITGTIKDLTNTVVTSGKVTFTLTPNRDTTISGIARFTPTTITCLINASGLIKAQDGVSVCTLTMNTALSPAGTFYSVAVWPYGVKTSSFSFYAVLSTYDWSTVVPTPTTSPAQNFADVFSNQTIGGNKTFSGTTIFSGPLSFPGGITGSTVFTGATAACSLNGAAVVGGACASTWGGGDIGAQINAAVAGLGANGGHIHVTAGAYPYATPIAIIGNGKPVTLDCDAGGAGAQQPITGPTVLNYTPVTGTAVTLSESLGAQLRGCTIAGPGPTTAAVGLLVGGPTNANSTISAVISENNISNFGVGIQFGNNSYINTFLNNVIHDNGPNGGDKNVYVPSGIVQFGENITFIGGQIKNNPLVSAFSPICVDILNGGSFHFYGVSFDQCGITINTSSAIVDLTADHMENPVFASAADFVTLGTACVACSVNFYGGDVQEDGASARTEFILETSNQSNNANSVSITGTSFTSPNAIPVVNAAGGGSFASCCQRIAVRDYTAGGSVTGPFIGTWLGKIFEAGGSVQINGQLTVAEAMVAGGQPTSCTFTSGGGTTPSCAFGTGSTNTAGTIIATTGTGSPAGTGTITLSFFQNPFGTNAPVCEYQASDGGAGQWAGLPVFKDKTATTTSDLFTWTNQPAATGANTIAVPTALSTSTAYWINYQCWAK